MGTARGNSLLPRPTSTTGTDSRVVVQPVLCGDACVLRMGEGAASDRITAHPLPPSVPSYFHPNTSASAPRRNLFFELRRTSFHHSSAAIPAHIGPPSFYFFLPLLYRHLVGLLHTPPFLLAALYSVVRFRCFIYRSSLFLGVLDFLGDITPHFLDYKKKIETKNKSKRSTTGWDRRVA